MGVLNGGQGFEPRDWDGVGEPASPCLKKCQLGKDTLCQGCFRTIEEISSWPLMSNVQKAEVLKSCRLREAIACFKSHGEQAEAPASSASNP